MLPLNIHEYQAAEILKQHGIPINPGVMVTTAEAAKQASERFGGRVVIKAQVHTGGRGKAGGVKLADSPQDAATKAEQILGMDIKGHTVRRLLIAPAVSIAQEYYLGVVLDRPARRITMMTSAEGGMDIEEVARVRPGAIIRELADPSGGLFPFQARRMGFDLGLPADKVPGFAFIASMLYETYVAKDATLVEINPLILTTDGEWMALDAKMSFDDNALWRHPETEALRDFDEENASELEARESGISFVKLDGNIGCIVNGAGLAMATMDAVKLHGGEPANFLDVGGGASAEQVAKAFRLVTADPSVRAILINIFGGITRGDVVAAGIHDAMQEVGVSVPIVVRLSGTNAAAGQEILRAEGLTAVETMDEAARQVVVAAG